jgi:hypothetical protein
MVHELEVGCENGTKRLAAPVDFVLGVAEVPAPEPDDGAPLSAEERGVRHTVLVTKAATRLSGCFDEAIQKPEIRSALSAAVDPATVEQAFLSGRQLVNQLLT